MAYIEVVGEAIDVPDTIRLAEECKPEIILLDIQMPGGTGFDVIEGLPNNPPAIIFVTAFDHHALQAFDAAAVDYVTKPVEPGRLALALTRARAAVEARHSHMRAAELTETVSQLRGALKTTQTQAVQVWVKVQGQHVRIASDRIVSIHAERDYASIRTESGAHLYGESLASLEKRLDPGEFLRIHRSTIVRILAVTKLRPTPTGSLIAVMVDGSEQRIGKTYLRTIRQRIMETPQHGPEFAEGFL